MKNWKNIEYFDVTWEKRVKAMAYFIPEGFSVIDLGCGMMYLKKLLQSSAYIPVDYKSRGLDTVICDFNKHQFPESKAEVVFISGCLEYVEDYKWFVASLSQQSKRAIVSYCSLDNVPDFHTRKSLSWVNNLTKDDVRALFRSNGMKLVREFDFDSNNTIFVFDKEPGKL